MNIEERIERLENIEAIRYLQAKYQRGLDTRDFNVIAECFSDNVVSSYANGTMNYSGKEKVIEFLMSVMTLDMPSAHMIHGGEIDIIDSKNACAKWYLQDFLINKKHGVNISGAAIYDVRYIKIDKDWKINEIGYKRLYEFMEKISDTEKMTLKNTTYFDEIKNSNNEKLKGFNKEFYNKTAINKE